MDDLSHHVDDVVRAAGGVVTNSAGRIAVVWRPHRQDWSLPKGKQEPEETDEQTALREVLEETGMRTNIAADLGTVSYQDHRGRPKVVRYFHLAVIGGTFTPNDEVSRLDWLTAEAAESRLSYDTDRQVILRFTGRADPDRSD